MVRAMPVRAHSKAKQFSREKPTAENEGGQTRCLRRALAKESKAGARQQQARREVVAASLLSERSAKPAGRSRQ
jgi:hypothetical protein